MQIRNPFLFTTLVVISLLLSACSGGKAELTPTLGPDAIQTAAVQTFSISVTQTALAAPTKTALPTNTLAPTITAPTLSNITPFATNISTGPTASCFKLTFVKDVTIPDNTAMNPGQTFTKTWKVVNNGTCAWEAGFKLTFTGGDAMNGAFTALAKPVPANSEIDLSVAMTAPAKSGTIRSNWRMTTATGQYFGDEIYVVIIVGGTTGTPPTPTNTGAPAAITNTPTATATSTAPAPTATQ